MPKVLLELDLRRRNCARCTRWKHAIDFPWRWKTRGVVREIPLIHNVCLVCKSEIENARYHALSPAQKQERGRQANERARQRRWGLQEEVEESHKVIAQFQEREEQIALYKKRVSHSRKHNDEIHLDIVPIRMLLLRQARIRDGGASEIAALIGVNEAIVRRHLNGFYWEGRCDPRPIRTLALSTIDRYLVILNAEERLEELYPEVDDLLEEFLGREQ